MIDYSKIKLIIWDLDDTFWKGTLSEGAIEPIKRNCLLIKKLTERGIVNTICSKNNYDSVVQELQELGIIEYFVFISVDWTPKGNRIAHLINEMGLRPLNCLFLDDNVVNLNEARYYSHDLQIGDPVVIDELEMYVDSLPVSDARCTRLAQYKILEQKQRAKAEANDNLAFLYASNTRVQILHDCLSVTDRIYELIQRTNQLNFTKNRCSKEELIAVLNDSSVDCAYVTVKDNYGDYGIVGFYAMKNNSLIHFLFSCRTIGQGVEQWVYSTIGCPTLSIVQPVVNGVEPVDAPLWINQETEIKESITTSKTDTSHIVFKGPCDMEILSSYLVSANLIKEFTYVGSHLNSVEHHNHSINYLRFHFLSTHEREQLLNECIFNDKEMFHTKMYEKDTSLVFLSTLMEANLGVYRRRRDGYLIAWGEWFYPLTEKTNWPLYIDGKIYTGGNKFTVDWLQEFSVGYEFLGRLSPDEVVTNILEVLKLLPEKSSLCLLLGSEMPYVRNSSPSYDKRELYHKELNEKLRLLQNENSRLYLIDFNDYITSQSDFTNNINHFQRRVYFEVSKKANEVITTVVGAKAKEQSWLGRCFNSIYANVVSLLGRIKVLVIIVRWFKRLIR